LRQNNVRVWRICVTASEKSFLNVGFAPNFVGRFVSVPTSDQPFCKIVSYKEFLLHAFDRLLGAKTTLTTIASFEVKASVNVTQCRLIE
jgi:hypothetical protein